MAGREATAAASAVVDALARRGEVLPSGIACRVALSLRGNDADCTAHAHALAPASPLRSSVVGVQQLTLGDVGERGDCCRNRTDCCESGLRFSAPL